MNEGGMGRGGETGSGGATESPDGRRLPLPCTAPLPTGYCFVSTKDDYIGGGESSQASGNDSVRVDRSASGFVGLTLQNASNGDDWRAEFAAPDGASLAPGLYDPAMRYPFQLEAVAGLSIAGNGRGCNELTGKFAVEELKRSPADGLQVVSVTFEQRCESQAAALRGVINFNATGIPDRTPKAETTISIEGKVFRVVYDPEQNIAYGLDASNRRLAKIDLTKGDIVYADVVQVPNDACLNAQRQRLFVVNKGSSLITEYDARDLSRVRDIAWSPSDWRSSETRFKIYCAPQRVYLADGAWTPGLFSFDVADDAEPAVVDHSEQIAGVGGLVVNALGSELFYWKQVGWSAGNLNTSVHRLAADLSELDVSGDVADFNRDPLDAPLLLDEGRGLIFSKSKIFDATNLTKLVYSLPSEYDTFGGASENAYALDAAHGRVATKNFVYELEQYKIVSSTVVDDADQLFFDANGALWFLSISSGTLAKQVIEPSVP